MSPDSYLLVFAIAFMGCVLTTPMVTKIAAWAGAIDRPDQFRRIHKGATPRLGGLGLAFGLALSLLPMALGSLAQDFPGMVAWWSRQWAVVVAAAVVLGVGAVDDTRGMSPRIKLLGQSMAVLILYIGGIRIEKIAVLGMDLMFSYPLSFQAFGQSMTVDPASLLVTLLWFVACMNVWNLIDGMDGLASGVGLLVSGTLMLVAYSQDNYGAALMAAALAGGLAGFLLYNWHPACIFLGDSGSMLIGLLIGVIGVQGSLKGTTTVSILLPILAMGLPISDTAMAIFRRWLRNLPLSSADRRHVHHLLIGLGLDPRQAALLLYCFTGFLCGVVLLGVAAQSEILALALGLLGCAAFLLILYSRRDELTTLRADFLARFQRGRQERHAAKVTWESIQKIELCTEVGRILDLMEETARTLGCDAIRISCQRRGRVIVERDRQFGLGPGPVATAELSGATASFRLTGSDDLVLAVALHQATDSVPAADIAFRFLQRLSLATAERIGRLLGESPDQAPAKAAASPTAAGGADPDMVAVPTVVAATNVPAPAVAFVSGAASGLLRWALAGPWARVR